jgi:hypothetical protein
MSNLTKTSEFKSTKMWETISKYDAYYGIKRTERNKFIMNTAINRFVLHNDLETPNQYLLYLIADKAFNVITSKSEQGRIVELVDELEKDLHLLQRTESL